MDLYPIAKLWPITKLMVLKLYLGLFLPLATGNRETAYTSKQRDHILGGQYTVFYYNWRGNQSNWVGNWPLVYLLKEALT